MPLSISCPGCAARLKAPDAAAGRTVRCPRCQAAISVPAAGPAADFRFESPPGGTASHPGEDNPFTDEGPSDSNPARKRRPTTQAKPKEGYNPFDADAGDAEPEGGPARKRKYRKDGDYNPFGDLPAAEVPDPVGDGFDFGVEAPPEAPAGEFDFGPHDPRGDDEGTGRRRR
jgi:hypothetical protein